MPELIQHEAQPQVIADEIRHFLNDQDYRQRTIDSLAIVRQRLGKLDATAQVAALTLEMLDEI